MANGPIQRLNDDCLFHIFQYLSIVDRIKLERVCKRWQAVSLESWRTFKKFDLSRTTWGLPATDKFSYIDTHVLKKVLTRCGRFLLDFDICKPFNEDGTISRKDQTKLHIIGATGNVLSIIEATCPNLETIYISDPCVNLLGLHSLVSRCQNISKFCLVSKKWIWYEEDLGNIFSSLNKLKYLKISCNNITGKCLSQLPDDIEEIHLMRMVHSSCRHVSDAINKFGNLKSLTIDAYPYIESDLLKSIASHSETLRNLRLSGYVGIDRMTEPEIRVLSKFENLEVLDFRSNCYITNEALAALATSCKKVNYINISYCFDISEKGIFHLASKMELENLIANGLTKITGENFGKMYSLKNLECRNCHRLKEENLCNLIRGAPDLELLDISWNKLNVNNIIYVADEATKRRTNLILKLFVGHTNRKTIEISSPFLNVIDSSSDESCREILNSI
ncbi:F-box protein SKIP2-like [Belonocnema kinseyi]|uniref:F-box protein SKIP2-like n=1 Tax=Belonocnema kinseyi TaxID=2817044 RepID=UPI00143D0529|nr:F-box protein SKIP2-like [Belonocnema kinseyi]